MWMPETIRWPPHVDMEMEEEAGEVGCLDSRESRANKDLQSENKEEIKRRTAFTVHLYSNRTNRK